MYTDDVQGIPQLKPAFHQEFFVGERVVICESGSPDINGKTGEIIGVGSANIVFSYIILLDDPLKSASYIAGDKPWRGVLMFGGQLRKIDNDI